LYSEFKRDRDFCFISGQPLLIFAKYELLQRSLLQCSILGFYFSSVNLLLNNLTCLIFSLLNMNKFIHLISTFLMLACGLCSLSSRAQTESDALMIPGNYLCSGAFYGHTSWSSYWEGTFKRKNGNLGTVSSNAYTLMVNYGISNRLNIMASVPYITTIASAGTLALHAGFQDLMLTLKYVALKFKSPVSQFRLITTASGILPLSNYEADFLPLSIGSHSKRLMARLMADYQIKHFFFTGSGAYIYRGNISIDRDSYYTTSMHYTHEVFMPDQFMLTVRTGLRTKDLIAELVFQRTNTLGGFDMRKNDMPFPSNRMNDQTIGANFKYTVSFIQGLELSAGADYVVAGRNVGQSSIFHAGLFYLANLSGKSRL